jgi:hypothetical protein
MRHKEAGRTVAQTLPALQPRFAGAADGVRLWTQFSAGCDWLTIGRSDDGNLFVLSATEKTKS